MSEPSTTSGAFFGPVLQALLWMLGTFWNILHTWPFNWIFIAFGFALAISLGVGLGLGLTMKKAFGELENELKKFGLNDEEAGELLKSISAIGQSKEDFNIEDHLYKKKEEALSRE